MKKIRTVIVDDSPAARKIRRRAFEWDPVFEVIGEGDDGRDAVALSEKLKPDFMTLDMEMPEVDGLQALEAIMSTRPMPIAMLTSIEKREADRTVDRVFKRVGERRHSLLLRASQGRLSA